MIISQLGQLSASVLSNFYRSIFVGTIDIAPFILDYIQKEKSFPKVRLEKNMKKEIQSFCT